MKKTTVILFFAHSLLNQLNAQCVGLINLFPNPSFESTTVGCAGDNQLYFDQSPVLSWFGTDPTTIAGSTPDLRKANGVLGCGNQENYANNNCISGERRLGYFAYATGNSREYVQAQLNSPLIPGQLYCVSVDLWSRVGGSGAAMNPNDGFGMWFHDQGLINIQTMNGGAQFLGSGSIINATPQVQLPSGSMITTCTTITQTFTASGGETHVVIGNFRDNASTTTVNTVASAYNSFDNITLFEDFSLPIQLLNFSGNCSNGQIELKWSTASERNNDFFTIEYSCDGIEFVTAEIIQGSGNTSTIVDYHAALANLCPGISYYRLSQTDYDGTKETFDIISIDCPNSSDISIYPNPAFDELNIRINKENSISIEIFDSAGRLILEKSFSDLKLGNHIKLDISSLSQGVYSLRSVAEGNEVHFTRFIKI